MADVVVVSNRGPLSFRLDASGRPEPAGSGGGLAASFHRLLAGTGATWVFAPMGEADRLAAAEGLMLEDGLRLVTVPLDADTYRMAYDVVSNASLWYCHHHLFDLPRRPRFDRHWREAWDAYRRLNRAFADAVAGAAAEGSVVLVQDYHLSLTGRMLAEARPDLATVHFSHTPFAGPDMLRVLPSDVAGELLAGMAGFGCCGFHTRRWEAAFRDCYADPELAGSARPLVAPPTFHSPLGPDPEAVLEEAAAAECDSAAEGLSASIGDRLAIVRVDRIELSKNILRGLHAFDELLERRPRWRGRVVLVALAYPSREGLADYLAYRSEVEHTVSRINERWATGDWTPILLDLADDRARSVAALRHYDVLLVNPVRDGLNLVAKEGALANRNDGVLVISREAGAWAELHPAALGVNPFDVTATADALDAALAMDAAERARRAGELRRLVAGRTAADWLADLLGAADRLSLAGR
jgi:trehalose 6-phosphate synthase